MRALVVAVALISAVSIAWAASPYLLVTSTTSSAYPDDAEYISHTQCKVCHNSKADGEQWNVWQSMGHANAIATLETDEAKAVAAEAGVSGNPAEAAQCLQCHVTAYDVEAEAPPAKIKIADGVQCESCHGPASLHAADGKTLKFSPGQAGDIDVTANLAKISEVTCKQCHNDKSPTWDPERYTTADGEKVGFDYDQAAAKIAHLNPKNQ